MYDTAEEATQKLVNSTVLFDGNPVQVVAARGGRKKIVLDFKVIPLSLETDSSYSSELLTDSRWDFRSLGSKLGYVNIESSPFDGRAEALFCTRVPTRVSRQGLDGRTAKVLQFPLSEHPWDWERILYSGEALVKTLKRQFPTAKQATEMVLTDTNNIKSVAFGPKLMMIFDKVNPPNLVYRNEKIGYTEDGLTFKLAKHKQHLTEELSDMERLKIA